MKEYKVNGEWDGVPIVRDVTSAEKLVKEMKKAKAFIPPSTVSFENIPQGYDNEGNAQGY